MAKLAALRWWAIEAHVEHPDCPDCCPGSSTVRDSGLFFSGDADIPHGEAGDEAEQRVAELHGLHEALDEKKVASGETELGSADPRLQPKARSVFPSLLRISWLLNPGHAWV